jgi:hypothetical protein
MKQEMVVPFAGAGAGVEELTWGQRNIWRMMENFGNAVMVGGTMPLPAGTTMDHIVHLLEFIVSRHESMRTRIQLTPDGVPQQRLFDAGSVTLEVIDVEPGEDPAEVGEHVRERFENEPFDIEKQWPPRVAVIRRDGVPVQFTAMYPHMAIDGYGFEALRRDLMLLDRATGEAAAPRSGVQPRDLARRQLEPGQRRVSDNSIRYWERLLRTVPARRFNEPVDERSPRWWEVFYDSPAGYLALAPIAARTGLPTGAVLLGAYAVALGRATGVTPTVMRMLVSNRFRPDFAESVSILAQPSLCAVDVADCGFDEVAKRAFQGMMAAGKNGYYDPRDLWSLLDRVNEERGVEVDIMLYFNDGRRTHAAPRPGPLPTPDEIRAALPRAEFTVGVKSDVTDVKCVVDFLPVADTLRYMLKVDTRAVGPAEQESIVRMIEEILVAAAWDGDAPTGIAAYESVG